MKGVFKAFRPIMILTAFLLVLTGCSPDDGADYLFRYSLTSDPAILDPQLATDSSSLMLVTNMFDGLVKTSENGQIVNGVAESYQISTDNLTYTFKLRAEATWMGQALKENIPITSQDFIFAFQRLFDPVTRSPHAKNFTAIKNSQSVIDGQLAPTEIGVSAPDSHTVVFQLEHPSGEFLQLLTTPPAAPCQKEFFEESQGKYGLSAEASISNGAFYLKEWQYDPYGKNNHLILRRNTARSAYDRVFPSSLNFFIQSSTTKESGSGTVRTYSPEEVAMDNFLQWETDCIALKSPKDMEAAAKAKNAVSDHFQSLSYGLIFNPNTQSLLKDPEFKAALALAVEREQFKDSLPENLTAASGIVPGGVTVLNKSFRELIAEPDISNLQKAKEHWQKALQNTAVLNEEGMVVIQPKRTVDGIKILMPASFTQTSAIQHVTQQWQAGLDFFCGLEVVNDQEYESRLEAGNFDVALVSIHGTANSPKAFISYFLEEVPQTDAPEPSPEDTIPAETEAVTVNSANEELLKLLELAEKEANLNQALKLYSQCEELIVSQYGYIPLFYGVEALFYRDTMQNILFDPFTGCINFERAKEFK